MNIWPVIGKEVHYEVWITFLGLFHARATILIEDECENMAGMWVHSRGEGHGRGWCQVKFGKDLTLEAE